MAPPGTPGVATRFSTRTSRRLPGMAVMAEYDSASTFPMAAGQRSLCSRHMPTTPGSACTNDARTTLESPMNTVQASWPLLAVGLDDLCDLVGCQTGTAQEGASHSTHLLPFDLTGCRGNLYGSIVGLEFDLRA